MPTPALQFWKVRVSSRWGIEARAGDQWREFGGGGGRLGGVLLSELLSCPCSKLLRLKSVVPPSDTLSSQEPCEVG